MPPTLILIRHGQAAHNATNNIRDPPLTEEGFRQCVSLRESLKERLAGETDIAIIVSPMRRTLQTALSSLDWLVEGGTPITADAAWQEISAKPCDTGTSVDELAREFPSVDFSAVDPVYPDKTSPAGSKYFPTKQAVLDRARDCLRSLRQRPEKWVIVVSHSAFLRKGMVGWWFFNGDYRIFDFEDEDSDEGDSTVNLTQWESTLSGGLGLSRTDPVIIGLDLEEKID